MHSHCQDDVNLILNILKNFACRGVLRTSATCYPECRNEREPAFFYSFLQRVFYQ
jgi:hypothetical protein